MDKSIENEGPPEEIPPAGPTEESLSLSSTEQRDKMLRALKEDPDGQHAYLMKNACVHCGLCADSCHYYLSSGDPELIPAVKAEKLSRALRKKTLLGSEHREALLKAAFQDCSLCGRCTLSCPVGLSTRRAMYVARTMFSSIEKLPPGLDGPVQTALETGNYIEMSTEDFV